jgi:hypothetical protein
VGQIAGPTTQQGQWNPDEWLPAMIKSSITMRCVLYIHSKINTRVNEL